MGPLEFIILSLMVGAFGDVISKPDDQPWGYRVLPIAVAALVPLVLLRMLMLGALRTIGAA